MYAYVRTQTSNAVTAAESRRKIQIINTTYIYEYMTRTTCPGPMYELLAIIRPSTSTLNCKLQTVQLFSRSVFSCSVFSTKSVICHAACSHTEGRSQSLQLQLQRTHYESECTYMYHDEISLLTANCRSTCIGPEH